MTTQKLWERMVEDAARAICCPDAENRCPNYCDTSATYNEEARAALRAALKTMREPSESMIKYGEFNLDGCRGDECDKEVLHTYRTMLDELIRTALAKE